MAKFYMFYGAQVYEFERPEIVVKSGVKAKMIDKKYKAIIKPYTAKVVIKT